MSHIIDCFPFFNELDVLEVRLNSLAPFVDRFVLAECPRTHSGNPKLLYFNRNKDRFKDFNITHLIIPPIEGTPWELERYGREYLMNGIKDAEPEDTILLSDLDEIPNLSSWDKREGVFEHKLYCYYFNCLNGSGWKGTVALRKKNITDMNSARDYSKAYPIVGDGWHFSNMGTAEQVIEKIEAFAHQEFNTIECKSKVREHRDGLIAPYHYNGSDRKFKVELPAGLSWLLENKERYPHLWLKR